MDRIANSIESLTVLLFFIALAHFVQTCESSKKDYITSNTKIIPEIGVKVKMTGGGVDSFYTYKKN